MSKPETWDKAARICCDELLVWRFGVPAPSLNQCVQRIRSYKGYEWELPDWRDIALAALEVALESGRFSADAAWMVDQVAHILIAKQADYGSKNITTFGHQGIAIRFSDKFARLENLLEKGADPENEPVRDTYLDLIGYAVLGMMLARDWFDLPLERDVPNNVVELPFEPDSRETTTTS